MFACADRLPKQNFKILQFYCGVTMVDTKIKTTTSNSFCILYFVFPLDGMGDQELFYWPPKLLGGRIKIENKNLYFLFSPWMAWGTRNFFTDPPKLPGGKIQTRSFQSFYPWYMDPKNLIFRFGRLRRPRVYQSENPNKPIGSKPCQTRIRWKQCIISFSPIFLRST